MSTDDLRCIVENDPKIVHKDFEIVENPKDPNHLERKQQQRAINEVHILIALNYGVMKRTFRDKAYTLTDRILMDSPYFKYVDKLRGLTVIGYWVDDIFHVITSYWDYTVKSRKRF